jgi:hypothetical protein
VPQISNGKSANEHNSNRCFDAPGAYSANKRNIRLSRRRVDELPRNALSKVDRNMLQTMAAGTDKARQIEAAASQPKPPDERPTRRVARIDRPSYTKAYGGHHPP